MICPECKEDMLVVEYQRIELDYCPACEGVWFDSGELDLLLVRAKLGDPRELMQEIERSPKVQPATGKRKCPVCHKGMQERGIGESATNIDVCEQGDGIWFDGGEVQQVLTHLAQKCRKGEDSRQEIICFLREVFPLKTGGQEINLTEAE